MGIFKNSRDRTIDCCCDGCGKLLALPSTNWFDGKDAIDQLGWYTIATDYGCPDGPAWEHFCCDDCLDPPEWG
jgi:hypothetical protein